MPGATDAGERAACWTITPRWRAPRSPCSRRAGGRTISTPRGGSRPRRSSASATARAAFILTAADAADVPGARPRHAHDGATPSGVGLLLEVFARLWHLTDEARWRAAADGLIGAFSGAPDGMGGSPLLLMGADMLERGGAIVIDGPHDHPAAEALAAAALRAPDPSLTVLRLDRRLWPSGSPRPGLPQAAGPAAMLCQGQTCSLPVTTPETLAALLKERATGVA